MCSFQASKHIFFFSLLFLLPAALEVLIYEVTFLRQYDSTIISFWVGTEYSASITQKRKPGLNAVPNTTEQMKALGLLPRALICFSVSVTRDEALVLVFDILLEGPFHSRIETA